MAKKAKKKASKKAVKKSSKKVAKKSSTPAKKPAKKAAKKKARRTTMYSSGGKKLYAVRAADGTFKDIQQYSKAHAADLRASSKAEEAAEAKNSTPSAGM
jgi:DNA-binding protein HU-beta